jgi:molybdopterin-binding protein
VANHGFSGHRERGLDEVKEQNLVIRSQSKSRRTRAISGAVIRDSYLHLAKPWLRLKSHSVMSTSIRNRLPGTIEQIVPDKVVSEIVINTAAGPVTPIITTGSVKRMNLKKGDAFSP